jgi:hypothetical protein
MRGFGHRHAMRPLIPTVLALAGLNALVAPMAFAEEPERRPVVVVAIAPAASELDAPKLRAAIGAELEVEAVPEDDPLAGSARGRFDVSVDRAAAELVVSYVGGPEPLVRRVGLPPDAQAEARAVVALAGNLGRDEAGDLVAQIRKVAPREPPPTPPASNPEEAANERDEQLLMRMLADDARRDRTTRLATSLTFIGVGVAAIVAGSIDASRADESRVAPLVTPLGLPLILLGIFGNPFVDTDLGLTRHSRLERLSAYYPPDSETGRPWARSQVEQMWKKTAIDARRERSGIVLPLVAIGTLGAGLGAFLLVAVDRHDTLEASIDISSIVLGAGVVVWALATTPGETDTEFRLHEYERAVGRPIVQNVELGLAPVRTGAAVNVTGRF